MKKKLETIGVTRVVLGSAVGVLGLHRDPCVGFRGFVGYCVKLQIQDARSQETRLGRLYPE